MRMRSGPGRYQSRHPARDSHNSYDTVMHLGHLLSYNLDDRPDIIRVTKDLNRKEN